MSSSRILATALAGAALLAASACSSSGGSKSATSVVNTPSASVSPTSSPTPSASPSSSASDCVAGATYCDTFDDKSSGWPTANESHFFYNYDSYLGGTYRIGERTNSTITAAAPVKVPKISQDYSIQIDTDAVVGENSPSSGEFGVYCWDHPTSDGSSDSAFVFFISEDKAKIVLWDNFDGSPHTLTSKNISGLLKSGEANHLTAQCIQGSASGGPEAQLSLQINNQPAVSLDYALSTKNYEWSVGKADSEVGVLAAGEGEDVFYDNFALTSRCQPGGTFACPSPSAGASE